MEHPIRLVSQVVPGEPQHMPSCVDQNVLPRTVPRKAFGITMPSPTVDFYGNSFTDERDVDLEADAANMGVPTAEAGSPK